MAQNQLLLSRARSAVIARDFALAARLYKQLLRDDKDNIQLLNQLGNLYIKAGKDDQALGVFKRISELDSENCEPLITIGGIYRRLKRYDESIGTLEQALAIDGDNALISYNLGFTYKIMGDMENAISCFEDTIEMNPDDVLAYNHLGAIYASKGEYEKAVQTYQRGLNVDANHPVLLLNLAKSYEALGEYEKACAAYSGALRSRPLWNDAIDGYSRLLITVKRPREAYNLVNRAIAVNPKDKSLIDAFEHIKKYMQENSINPESEEDSPEETDMTAPETPETFELPKVDNSEFDADGLEIQMEDKAEFSEIEDRSLEASPEDEAMDLPVDDDSSGLFDFDSMGMDDLAGDGPLDPLVFNKADAQPEAEEQTQVLDDLIRNDEAPVDTEEMPVSDSGIFDDFEDDALFSGPAEEEDEVTALDDGEAPYYEDDDVQTPADKPSASKEDVDQLKQLADDLKEQVEKAQNTLDKANYAAEKAWDAAQLAADSAQAIGDFMPEAAEEEKEPEAEEAEASATEEVPEDEPVIDEATGEEEPEDEPVIDEAAGEEEASEDLESLETEAEEDAVVPDFPSEDDEAENVEIEDFDDFSGSGESADDNPYLSLFRKLKELLEFLPEDKKEEFQTSEIRLKMDYIISRLSGEKGLFEKASELIFNGEVTPYPEEEISTVSESSGKLPDPALLEQGISVLKNLTDLLPDENLKQAMKDQLDKIY